jgi:4-hydroxybenzoate polyprenyltransferase
MAFERDNKTPLYVDLDGTFIKTDMLYESFLSAIKKNPLTIFLCLIWLLHGRSHLKHQLSLQADIDVSQLPLNTEFYNFLTQEKKNNRTIILATASAKKYAEAFVNNFSLFDGFISSDQQTNLKGKNKLDCILERHDQFSYAGNNNEDLPILNQAKESYLVNPSKRTRSKSLQVGITKIFDSSSSGLSIWLKQVRAYQWLKNSLIFVPLLVTGSFAESNLLISSLVGFISFCLLASATYIFNDLLDLTADRHHPRKKFRPLAHGDISLTAATSVAIGLAVTAFLLAFTTNDLFVYILLTYLSTTLLYSLVLKSHAAIDIIVLASLYTLRIFAGAAILNVTMSFWLLSFSMFIFFSLALIKRCSELRTLDPETNNKAKGRDYYAEDYTLLMSFGTTSAMLAVLMFCFYMNSDVLKNQYQEPNLLWLITPALCYWLTRMWIVAHRGQMHDDPLIYSLKDKTSILTIGFIVITTLFAQQL